MNKKSIIAVIAVFFVWSILDFLVHGLLLASIYEQTSQLWRPMDQMNDYMLLMYSTNLVYSICLVLIYQHLISNKSVCRGVALGFLIGIATGYSAGFGSYSFMPMPLTLAWSWFISMVVMTTIAGLIIGLIIKE